MNADSEIFARPFEDILHKARELRDQKCLTEAGKLYGHLLTLDPHHFESLLAMGVICQLAGNPVEANRYLEVALAIDPQSVSALVNHGVVLHVLERYEEALSRFDQAMALQPDHVEAIANRGTTLRHMHRYDESLEHYNRALAMKPDYAKAIANRGLTLHLMGRYAESAEDYRHSMALDPTYHHARWNLGINQLITGNWQDGWTSYEWRLKKPELEQDRSTHGKPAWTGKEDINGKTILLWAEQGFGDSIQFCRYVELVAARGADVMLQINVPALGRLFSTLKGARFFIDRQENPPDVFDYHQSLMSLPLVFHTTPETVPPNIPYLFSDPALVQKWRQRLGIPTRRRVGIAWSGNPKHKNDKVRSVPLHHFLRLKESGSELFVVQKDIRPEDRALLARHPDVHVFGAEDLRDFAETAALMECMDLIVSTDTSTAHLAGALGLPVWVTLSFVPEWRWMADGKKTPWYPTATLFRQRKQWEWDGVVESMLERLKTENFPNK